MTPRLQRINLQSSVCLFVSFIFGWLPAYILAPYHFDLHHDGLTLYNVDALNFGLVPYKEFFIQHGIATIQVHSIVTKLFGNSLLNLREFTSVCYGIAALLTYLIAKNYMPEWRALCATFLWAGSAYYISPFFSFYIHSWSSLYALIIILAIIYIYSSHKNLNWFDWFLFGILISICGLFKINYGVVSFLIIIVILFNGVSDYRIKFRIFLLITGIIIALSPYIVYIISNDALKNFYEQQILYALNFANSNQISRFNIFDFLYNFLKIELSWNNKHGGVSALNFILEYFTILILAFIFLFGKTSSIYNNKILDIGIISIICTLLYFPVPSLMHIYLSGPCFFIFISAISIDIRLNYILRLFLKFTLILYFVWEVLFNHLYKFFEIKLPAYSAYIDAPNVPYLKGLLVSKEMVNHLNVISEHIKSSLYNENVCYLNNTPQPYYNLMLRVMHPLNHGPLPFNWGYVNQIVNKGIGAQFCDGRTTVLSSEPYLLNGYYLEHQLSGIRAQDFSTPVTLYKKSTAIMNLEVEPLVKPSSIVKTLSQKSKSSPRYVASFKERYQILFDIKNANVFRAKNVTGVFLELMNRDFPDFKGIKQQIDCLESSKLLQFSTQSLAYTNNLKVYLNNSMDNSKVIDDNGLEISSKVHLFTITPDISFDVEDFPINYRLRLQFSDGSYASHDGLIW